MRRLLLVLPVVVAACSGAGDSSPLAGGDACTELADGTWTFSGAAFGMGDETMTGVVTVDVAACVVTIADWSMAMDDLPNGGVVDGDAVQLDGLNSFWRSCTGTAPDATHASGVCTDDGTAWAMAAGG